MKKEWMKILGISNLIAFVFILILYFLFLEESPPSFRLEYAFNDYGLPFVAGALYNLTIGIFTLKRKHWLWVVLAIFGILVAFAVFYLFNFFRFLSSL
jgi:hypothetical protein